MEDRTGLDMSRPAGAWAKKSGVQLTRFSNAPSRLSSLAFEEPKKARRSSSSASPPPFTKTDRRVPPALQRPPAMDAAPQSIVGGFSQSLKAFRVPRLKNIRGLTRKLAGAGMAFLVSAILVVVIGGLAFPHPVAMFEDPTPQAAPVLQAALARGSGTSSGPGDSPVPEASVPAVSIDGSTELASLGSIRIPDIGVDARYYSGVHDGVVEKGPGLWPGTPLPGSPGNSVFAGHRTTHAKPFEDLDLVESGDLIETTQGSGTVTQFRVVSVETIPESEYVDYVLAAPDSPEAVHLTLFACAPKSSRTHRIVVRAVAGGPVVPGTDGGDA